MQLLGKPFPWATFFIGVLSLLKPSHSYTDETPAPIGFQVHHDKLTEIHQPSTPSYLSPQNYNVVNGKFVPRHLYDPVTSPFPPPVEDENFDRTNRVLSKAFEIEAPTTTQTVDIHQRFLNNYLNGYNQPTQKHSSETRGINHETLGGRQLSSQRQNTFTVEEVPTRSTFATPDKGNEEESTTPLSALHTFQLNNNNQFRNYDSQRSVDHTSSSFAYPISPEQNFFATQNSVSEANLAASMTTTTTTTTTTPAPIVKSRIDRTVTIVVTGRSGSGVSSTIRELIGHETKCIKPEEKETITDIMEYTISDIPSNSGKTYNLKLIDLPGFVDGRTMEQDAQIMATLKSYITLAGPPGPDFFLVLSRFDDNRIFGEHSLFVQLVNRMELFKNMFLDKITPESKNSTMPFIFLLTRLMSETKVNQRRPWEKIETFQRAISDYSQPTFSSLVSLVVGENKAVSEYNAKVVDGYSKLPNKELYPKNIWQALINATNSSDFEMLEILNSLIENRLVKMTCEAKVVKTNWELYEDDADAFEFLMKLKNTAVDIHNDINHDINFFFERKGKSPQKYVEEIVQKTALQLYLQNENIAKKKDLPKDYAGKAAFFQKSSLVSATIPALLLDESFKLKMPEYVDALTVGYGYSVLSDDKSPKTPFNTTFIPSPVGYQLPNFMKCRKFPRQEVEDFMFYSDDNSQYFQKRLEYLDFPGNENVSLNLFNGKVKEGYNLPPEEGSSIASLIAVKEIRVLKCSISDSRFWEFNEDFLATMDELTPFVASDHDSVNEWKSFFDRFGSHIIVKSFGGGSLHGSIVGEKVLDAMKTRETIESTLNSVMTFAPFADPDIGIPSYRFYGGEIQNNADELYEISESSRDELLKSWRESLNSKFVMLKNQFVLEPISSIIKKKIGEEEGEMVEEAIAIYLKGDLKYSRSNRRKQGGKTGLRKPKDRPRVSGSGAQISEFKNSSPFSGHSSGNPSPVIPSQNSGSGQNSLAYESSDAYKELLEISRANLENANTTIVVVNKTLEIRRNQDIARHEKEVRLQRRHEEERRRKSKDQLEQLAKESEKNRREMMARYNSFLNQIKSQGHEDEQHYQNQINELRYQNQLEEERHQLLLKTLEKRRKEEEERLRQQQQNQCSWIGSCLWQKIVG